MLCCRSGHRIAADYTDFFAARPETVENARNRCRGGDFKPIQTRLSPAPKAVCDYTKRPEVNPHLSTNAAGVVTVN
jgi:hypothetical protein